MTVLIPTYGRSHRQTTYAALRQVCDPVLVVQKREADKYSYFSRVAVLPDNIRTIGPTRQWIFRNYTGRIVMFDDDLDFAVRRNDDPTKFRAAAPEDLAAMIGQLYMEMDNYDHVGIAAREGANRNTQPYLYNTRMMRVLGYDLDALQNVPLSWDALECMEDFHVTLTLLRSGRPNLLLNRYVHNQSGSGAEGGCSHFRTPEVQAAAAHKLKELHPDFVTVVTKTTKTAWGGGTRTDVRIQWKRAYSSGVAPVLGNRAGEDTES
jgi:hypothetical protein